MMYDHDHDGVDPIFIPRPGRRCPHCRSPLDFDARYCHGCGHDRLRMGPRNRHALLTFLALLMIGLGLYAIKTYPP